MMAPLDQRLTSLKESSEGEEMIRLINKSINDTVLKEMFDKKIKEEMKDCTFKPQINQKSLNLLNSGRKAQHKKQLEMEKVKVDPIFPMKPRTNKLTNHKPSLNFDIFNNIHSESDHVPLK